MKNIVFVLLIVSRFTLFQSSHFSGRGVSLEKIFSIDDNALDQSSDLINRLTTKSEKKKPSKSSFSLSWSEKENILQALLNNCSRTSSWPAACPHFSVKAYQEVEAPDVHDNKNNRFIESDGNICFYVHI